MLLDITFGLFIGKFFGIGILGVIFSLLPDIDFIFKSKVFSHRGVIHTPIFYILICIILTAEDIPSNIIIAFIIGTMFHLFHDLFVLGRGVMILYPFSKYRLKIFPDNGKDGYLKQKILWWNEEDTPKYAEHIGTENSSGLDNKHWIKIWYLRPNLFVVTETVLAFLFLFVYIML